MNIDNALVMLYKKELISNDEEKMVYKLVPYELSKGSISDGVFFCGEDCYDYIEISNDELGYAFILDLDEKDYSNCDNDLKEFFKEKEFYLTKLQDDDLRTFVMMDDDNLEEISMNKFDDLIDIFNGYNEILEKNRLKSSSELFDLVKGSVMCQDDQIKNIISIIAKNQRIDNPLLRSNILVCGNTGVGKSQVFNSLYLNSNIPVAFIDATDYKSNPNKSMDDMLLNLYLVAENNIDRAEKGVIVIDNLDKKIEGNNRDETSLIYDFMYELKKYMSNNSFLVQTPSGEYISFDTSYITFVLIGNFMDINFSDGAKKECGYSYNNNYYSITDTKVLKKFNLYPEFLGDDIVVFNDLSIDNLIEIITKSDISQLLLYKALYEKYNVSINIDDSIIKKIAEEAYKLKIGAYGIKIVVDKMFKDISYNVFGDEEYKEVIIGEDIISDNKKYVLKKDK